VIYELIYKLLYGLVLKLIALSSYIGAILVLGYFFFFRSFDEIKRYSNLLFSD